MSHSHLVRTLASILGVFAFLSAYSVASGREPNVAFTNLSFRDGLPVGEIKSCVRDSNGIVWIAGTGGLSRFDGYKVERVSTDRATIVFADSRGLLWVGTEAGLQCFDPLGRRPLLTLDHASGSQATRLTHPWVTKIAEDKSGGLWVGTLAGLNRIQVDRVNLQTVKCTVTAYRSDANDPVALPEGHITALLIDGANTVWVGTAGGSLTSFRSRANAFVTVWTTPSGVSTICNADETHLWVGTSGTGLYLFDIQENHAREMSAGLTSLDINSARMTSNGQMWVGTAQGLYRFNNSAGQFTAYYHEERNPYSLADDHIVDLMEDSDGILWASTHSGLSRFDTNRFWFEVFRYHPQKADGLRNGSIRSMVEIPGGSIAVGTSRGIDLLDKRTGRFTQLPPIANNFPGTLPATLYVDQSGTLWAGTHSAGLVRYDRKRNQFKAYRHSDKDISTVPAGVVSAILEDSQGNLWIGTNGGGLALFDRSTGKCRRYPPEPARPGNASGYIRCLIEDKHKRIWVGTVGTGLFRFDPATGRFATWGTPENGRGNETVTVVRETRDGSIWVGTEGTGIFKFDPLSKNVEAINSDNSPLPHDSVFGIVEDTRGAIWFSTGNGIARIAPEATGDWRVFNEADGLQSTLFHPNAALLDSSGLLYFGGPSGFNVIHPDTLPQMATPREPVLTGLELFGEPVEPGDDSILKKPIHLTNRVTVTFDPRNQLAFTFATLDYANPAYSRFRHRLIGADRDWVNAGQERRASYVALPPGRYPFEVQSSFDGENWSSNSARIELEVLPVWYQRWWAKWSAGAVGISLLSLFLAWTLYFRPFRIKQRQQELEMNSKKRSRSSPSNSSAECCLSEPLRRCTAVRETHSKQQSGN